MKSQYVLLALLYLSLCACPPPKVLEDPPEPPTTEVDPPTVESQIGNTHFYHWIQQPLHPANQEAVSFEVRASDPKGIRAVELALYEYELFTNAQGLPSKRRRPGGVWGQVDRWDNPTTDTLIKHRFRYADGFPARSNIEYIFSVIDSDGAVTRRKALFDAGSSPWPQDKILLYATQSQPLTQSINLCFFPDTDYEGNWSLFFDDVSQMIFQGYHQNNKIAEHKDYWSFYYTEHSTDGLALSQDPFNEERYPPFMVDSLIQGIDAFGLLHRQPYSDGAYLNSNIQFLAQNVFTAEGYNWGTAIHETAHAVFHLSDEYPGCACFSPEGGSNIFRSIEACQQFNEELGYGRDTCIEIVAYDGKRWYLPERPPLFTTEAECRAYNMAQGLPLDSCRLFQDFTGVRSYQAFKGVCIMEDDGDRQVPMFRHACAAVIDRQYAQLEPPGTIGEPVVLAEAVDNHFGYEPVMILQLKVKGEEVDMEMGEMCYGVPTKTWMRADDFHLNARSADGLLHDISLDRPDCIHIHHGKGEVAVELSEKTSNSAVVLPLLKGLSSLECQDNRKAGLARKRMDLSRKVQRQMERMRIGKKVKAH